jgi:hypothetical protein
VLQYATELNFLGVLWVTPVRLRATAMVILSVVLVLIVCLLVSGRGERC